MTIGEDRNKGRFINRQLCGAGKLPYDDHGVVKLKQNCVFVNNPCINLLVLPSVIREYHHKLLELLDLQQCIVACSAHWLGFLET